MASPWGSSFVVAWGDSWGATAQQAAKPVSGAARSRGGRRDFVGIGSLRVDATAYGAVAELRAELVAGVTVGQIAAQGAVVDLGAALTAGKPSGGARASAAMVNAGAQVLAGAAEGVDAVGIQNDNAFILDLAA